MSYPPGLCLLQITQHRNMYITPHTQTDWVNYHQDSSLFTSCSTQQGCDFILKTIQFHALLYGNIDTYQLNETACLTLLDSIFPCPEKAECEDSGLEALSKGFGGDVWPG